tara:strand:- start:711 stop:1946 length:1236 start_codon:yes stop_codon:yes gene_type:complete
MSSDKNLQEMEAGTKQSNTAVNAKAGAGDAMPKLTTGGTPQTWEDLGGPDPTNYKPDDNSAALKTPGSTLKQVKDVVTNRKGKKDGASGNDVGVGKKLANVPEEEEVNLEADQEVVAEDEVATDEVVAEEETTEEEVVAEEEATEAEETAEVVAEEEAVEEEDVIDVEEDVKALLDGEELSEEFQSKARTIFEAALRSKVAEVKEAMAKQYEESYEEKLVEEVDAIRGSITERIDSYLEYVAEEWVTENQLAIESGLKAEMTESFLAGMKSLFEEHYVSIPEDKYDVLENMVDKLDDMETKLNEQIEKNITLNKRLAESVAQEIFSEVSEGLALSQKEKLASLAESVEFESDEEYREKLETLKESYYPSKGSSPNKAKTETLSEGVDVADGGYSSQSMNAYLKTLSGIAKK